MNAIHQVVFKLVKLLYGKSSFWENGQKLILKGKNGIKPIKMIYFITVQLDSQNI